METQTLTTFNKEYNISIKHIYMYVHTYICNSVIKGNACLTWMNLEKHHAKWKKSNISHSSSDVRYLKEANPDEEGLMVSGGWVEEKWKIIAQ